MNPLVIALEPDFLPSVIVFYRFLMARLQWFDRQPTMDWSKCRIFVIFFSIWTTSFIVEWYLISNWIVDEDPSDRRMGPLQKTICTSICLPFTSVNKPTEIEADHRFHHPPALTSSRTKRRAVKWPAKTPLEPIYVYRSRLVPKVLCRCCCCTWSFQLKRSRRRCQWRREGNQAPVVVLFFFHCLHQLFVYPASVRQPAPNPHTDNGADFAREIRLGAPDTKNSPSPSANTEVRFIPIKQHPGKPSKNPLKLREIQ